MSDSNNVKPQKILNLVENTKTYPTLYIGLGGTGGEVLMRVRHHILNTHCRDNTPLESLDQFPNARFIYFDTEHHVGVGHPNDVVKFKDNEKINKFTMDDLSKYTIVEGLSKHSIDKPLLNQYPYIRSWWPFSPRYFDDIYHVPRSYMSSRPVSRLFFFDQYKKIKETIRAKIKELKAGISYEHTLSKLDTEIQTSKIRIVVICSSAGGTGSGTFLDMGWLSKSIAATEEIVADVELIMLLPTHWETHSSMSTANSYAALMEMELAMKGDLKYVEQWDDEDHPHLATKPYDDVYLIDTKNFKQQHAENITDVYTMVADSLFDDIRDTNFGRLKRFATMKQKECKKHLFLPFIPTDRFNGMVLSYSRAYSTFGRSTLEVVYTEGQDEHPICVTKQYLGSSQKNDHALYDALGEMSVIERQKVFTQWLQSAMPWINAHKDFTLEPEHFKCVIGVKDAEQFSKTFKQELLPCLPKNLGLNTQTLSIVDVNEKGRAVCYVELSGIPLNILNDLDNWRASYYKQSERRPLHTHIDVTQFRHPYPPKLEELNQLADDFKYYLKAVMLGVLKRCDVTELIPKGQYEFTVARGDVRRLGNERSFRQNGLPKYYRDNIHEQVQQKLNTLSSANLLMLISLTDVYEKDIYRPRSVINESGLKIERVGFACAMVKELKKELLALAQLKKILQTDIATAYELNKSNTLLEKWADVIKESDLDSYEEEISIENNRCRLKWALNMSSTVLQQHEQLLWPNKMGRSSQLQFYIAMNGQSFGPYLQEALMEMLNKQQIHKTTLIWHVGLTTWVPISNCSELTVI